MKFYLIFRHKGKKTGAWREAITDNTTDPLQFGIDVVAHFNKTLRSREQPRELVGVLLTPEGMGHVKHEWRKVNLVTISDRSGIYDKYKCEQCGVTGKRFDLNARIVRDAKYKAKVYDRCDTALKHLRKKGDNCG